MGLDASWMLFYRVYFMFHGLLHFHFPFNDLQRLYLPRGGGGICTGGYLTHLVMTFVFLSHCGISDIRMNHGMGYVFST